MMHQAVLDTHPWVHQMKMYFNDKPPAQTNGALISSLYFDKTSIALTAALGYIVFSQNLNGQKQLTSTSPFLTNWNSSMPLPNRIVLTLADKQGASGVTVDFKLYDQNSTPPTVWV
jgi:hypothetical protein